MWISAGSTLMAVTDDTIVAKFLQVRLRERFPECETHILTCDTDGRPNRISVGALSSLSALPLGVPSENVLDK